MKICLVTGGAGFIGSNFIIYMLEKYGDEIEIINIDSLTYAGNLENLRQIGNEPNYRFIKADICDEKTISAIFEQYMPDCVVHFAAESHVDRSIKTPEIFTVTNVLGTVRLLNLARKYWSEGNSFKNGVKFIQISTDEVYGSLPETGLFTEKTPLNPRSPYSASKAAADMLVKAYWETYRLPVNITRCSNNYGPYQFPEKLIPLILNNALSGKKLPIYGDGKNVRDWLYVADHVRAIDLVAHNGKLGEVYNIGGNNEKQNIELVNLLIDILQHVLPDDDERKVHINKSLIEFVKDRPAHDRRYAIDGAKIEKELGWRPETTFDEGMEKTVKWYLANGEWVKNVISGEYIEFYNEMYVKGERS